MHWFSLSRNKKFSDNDFRKFQDEIDYDMLSRTHIQLSNGFVKELRDKLNFSYLIYQNI